MQRGHLLKCVSGAVSPANTVTVRWMPGLPNTVETNTQPGLDTCFPSGAPEPSAAFTHSRPPSVSHNTL